ncbi:methyltransferase domain-containing protein [Hymenobacter sp. BT175]|uniref:class I SAM-dependent methyltransferase n=1 Tax=Hymenobacter translucens TaxID=2886507 RepID=UPI001D0EBB47|nr:class I SAM-dependent methyltransferase [Hymenobacter translucens]MCC2547199.1 methyltransferase domain-containing protein [Hymenobacter translucens]
MNSSPSTVHSAEQELAEQRRRWNQAFLDKQWRKTRFNPEPNTLLVDAVSGRTPGAALDVNMGEGRNALYLARQGWQVTGVDVADQALAFARERAAQQGVQLTTIEQNTITYDWGSKWDLVLLCYADEDAHAARAWEALRPGGLVVFENFHADVNQVWGSKLGKQVGFATNELKNLYTAAGFQVLRYEEPVGVADFTRETHRLVRLIAQKP